MPEGKSFIDQSFRDRDMTPTMVARESAPKRTWFIKRTTDGFIFAVHEAAASELMYNPQRVLRGRRWKEIEYEVVGVSDGKTYKKTVQESRAQSDAIQAEINSLKKEQDKFRKTEERMIFDDLVEPDEKTPQGEKLRKVKKIIADYDKKLDILEDKFRGLTTGILKTAFDAEYAVAKGNIVMPGNFNILTPGASAAERNKIIRAMGQ